MKLTFFMYACRHKHNADTYKYADVFVRIMFNKMKDSHTYSYTHTVDRLHTLHEILYARLTALPPAILRCEQREIHLNR